MAGGLRLNRRRGNTMLTLINAPSSWASCMCEMASSAPCGEAYSTYAMPLLVMRCLFIGMSRSEMSP